MNVSNGEKVAMLEVVQVTRSKGRKVMKVEMFERVNTADRVRMERYCNVDKLQS